MLLGIKRIVSAIFRRLLYFISLPTALALLIISPIIKIRLIGLQAFRIGHYALTTELMLCDLDLRDRSRKIKIIFYNMSKPCNKQMYKMWKRCIPIIPLSRLAIQVDQIFSFILGKSYRNDEIKKKYEFCGTGTIDKSGFLKRIKTPHLFFTEKEKKHAKNIINKLGIPGNAKFICLIVRDSAYLKKQYPETDWSYHDHRDADINAYIKSALYLANKGYYVLRMGKFVDEHFDVKHPKIIDYANHSQRSDFMDVYLCAHCFFCISTCTGLDCVSQIFRRPVLHTNISPIFGETLMWYPCMLFIPKLLKREKTNEFLTLSETNGICASLSSHDILNEFSKLDLTLVQNSENQILEAVMEMESRLCDKWYETSEQKKIQSEYWINQKKCRPIFVDNIYIKIGTGFLQSNQLLLQ